MKCVKGWYLPDEDTHFERWLNTNNEPYQIQPLLKALSFVTNFRVAVDVGAHVGFMTYLLKGIFQKVIAFEPNLSNFQCLLKNIEDNDRWTDYSLENVALSDREGNFTLTSYGSNSGASELVYTEGPVITTTLDNYDLQNVDFIKIDAQGSDFRILKGALSTLQQNSPVIMIEDVKQEKINNLLTGLGYLNVMNWKKDRFFCRRETYKLARRIKDET